MARMEPKVRQHSSVISVPSSPGRHSYCRRTSVSVQGQTAAAEKVSRGSLCIFNGPAEFFGGPDRLLLLLRDPLDEFILHLCKLRVLLFELLGKAFFAFLKARDLGFKLGDGGFLLLDLSGLQEQQLQKVLSVELT